MTKVAKAARFAESMDRMSLIDAWNKSTEKGFIDLLSDPSLDLTDSKIFGAVIKTAISRYNIKPFDMSDEFGVNLSTITRWSKNDSAPHKRLRPIIVDWIRQIIQLEADHISVSDDDKAVVHQVLERQALLTR
ncbi:MAG: hypothetical protein DRR06_06280 [Gammaproteobacteria bacterium]|nr:MAG: hypothetical protein DRR06_06280 [Gammaproteobacteria bacterium]